MLRRTINDSGKEKNRLFLSIGAFCVAIFIMAFSVVFNSSVSRAATAPAIVTYQGKLLVNSLSASTTQSMYFVLYDSATGGNALYTAAGTLAATSSISVTPSNGIFTVNLGGSGTNSLDQSIFQNNATVYLEVRVSNEILSPRKQITASPYAFNSRFLDGVAATSTASSSTYIPISDSNGNFTFNNVTTTNVTSTKIYATNASIFAGGLISNASSSFQALNISGNLNASSTIFVGGNLVPGANNSTNLGASGLSLANIFSSSTAYLQNVTISGTCVGCGGSTFTGQLSSPYFVTDGTTTSSLFANQFNIATSSANRLGLFGVDSSGNISVSGTSQTYGLSTLLGGFISNASSSIGGTLSDSGADTGSST
ncbi:MAG: hypothetical protein HY983_02005 [Candidatus Magasanikbacteria bacterium]|nr:hypothetical protein [Candidatus Magasanikbacteria bacterium]